MGFRILVGEKRYDREFLANKLSNIGQAILGKARRDQINVYCLCNGEPGVRMFIRKEKNGFVLFKPRGHAQDHHDDCPSSQAYESRISSRPAVIETDTGFKLRFNLTPITPRTPSAQSVTTKNPSTSVSVASLTSALDYRDLLYFIIHKAGYSEWSPAFSGKRDWGRLSYRIMNLAAKCEVSRGVMLSDLIVIPESREEKSPGWYIQSDLILQRVADINKKYGCCAILVDLLQSVGEPKHSYPLRFKHLKVSGWLDKKKATGLLSSSSFVVSSLTSHHGSVLSLFDAKISSDKYLNLVDGSLLTLCPEWIPCNDRFESMLISLLVSKNRTFRLNPDRDEAKDNGHFADLLDVGAAPYPLYLSGPINKSQSSGSTWHWDASRPDAYPELPAPNR